MVWRRLKQAQLPGIGGGLDAVWRAELAADIVDMGLDGAQGDDEFPGNLAVRHARSHQS